MSSSSAAASSLVGGIPNDNVDIPVSSVFLALFFILAVLFQIVFQLNRRRAHSFLMTHLMFVFCLIRVVTCALRIAWAQNLSNVSLVIVAQIFNNAGTLILWIVNLIFARRILNAAHPRAAANRMVAWIYYTILGILPVTFLMLVVSVAVGFTRTDAHTQLVTRDIRFYGLCYFLFISFIPLVLIPAAVLSPPRRDAVVPFGTGDWWTKIALAMATSVLGCTVAGFRVGTSFGLAYGMPGHHHWYTAKWAFYVFNFTFEFVALLLFLVFRVDNMFYIPSKKVRKQMAEADAEKGDRDSFDTQQETGAAPKA